MSKKENNRKSENKSRTEKNQIKFVDSVLNYVSQSLINGIDKKGIISHLVIENKISLVTAQQIIEDITIYLNSGSSQLPNKELLEENRKNPNKIDKEQEEFAEEIRLYVTHSLNAKIKKHLIIDQLIKKSKISSIEAHQIVDDISNYINQENSSQSTENPNKDGSFKTKLWKYTKIFAITGIAIYFIYILVQSSEIPFPELKEPRQVTFQWSYKSTPYTLPLTLYKSVDDYYTSKASNISCDNEDCYNQFLDLPKEDNKIEQIATAINNLGTQAKLDKDQIAGFTLTFIQSMPYDDSRISSNDLKPHYPYQVLFDQKGICTDKSFLALALFKKMGYGTSLFLYDNIPDSNIGHMAAGIECPGQYSTYNSGYCIAETTAIGWRIGEIPEVTSNGSAVIQQSLGTYDQQKNIKNNSIQLSNSKVISKSTGNIYQRIISTKQNELEMLSLSNYFDKNTSIIEGNEAELTRLSNQMNVYKSYRNYSAYNSLVPQYNNLLYRTNNTTDDYNKKVERYNQLLQEY